MDDRVDEGDSVGGERLTWAGAGLCGIGTGFGVGL